MKNNKGFTLIEILAACSILAILTSISVISVSNIIKQSRKNTFAANAREVIKSFRTDLLSRQYITKEDSSICALPPVGKYTYISLKEIDEEKNQSPWGKKMDYSKSYVLVINKSTSATSSGRSKTGKILYYYVGKDQGGNGIDYIIEESQIDSKYIQLKNKAGIIPNNTSSKASDVVNGRITVDGSTYQKANVCTLKN